MRRLVVACIAILTWSNGYATHPATSSLKLEYRARLLGSGTGESGSEIVAYDRRTGRVFAINASSDTVDVFDLRSIPPASELAPVLTISVAAFGSSPNSVDVHDGIVAVAVEAIN